MGTLHSFVAGVQSTTQTSAATTTSLRRVQAQLRSTSQAPASAPTMQRRLQALVRGQSLTPSVAIAVATERFFTAASLARSQTPVVATTLLRGVTALAAGQSGTADGVPLLTRSLTAVVIGTSTTGGSLLGTLVTLQAGVAGSSTTRAEQPVVMERIFISDIWGQVMTSQPVTFSTQQWTVRLMGTSHIPDPELSPFAGMMQLQAGIQGTSQTDGALIVNFPMQRILTAIPTGRIFVVPVAR